MGLERIVEFAARGLEIVGVAVVTLGAAIALVWAAVRLARRDSDVSVQGLRQQLGQAILVGLELLVGADIIRTVSHIPSLRQLAVLAGIVLIRTFLSFTLEVELEGRWPWQRRRTAEGEDEATS